MKEHRQHIHKLMQMRTALGKLYLHLVIQAISISMVSIFVPVYLLQTGFMLWQCYLFLLVEWSVFSLLAPLFGVIISRIGIKASIILRVPLYIASLIILTMMNQNPQFKSFYLLCAIMLGISELFYTLAVTSLFAELMHKKSEGIETGKFISLPSIGTILGPLVGGFISLKAGTGALFVVSSIILLLSILPILLFKSSLDHPKFCFKNFFLLFSKNYKFLFFMNLYGIIGFAFGIILPIILYLNNSDSFSLGIAVSLISLVSIFFTLRLGSFIDRFGKQKVLKVGAVLASLLFFIMGLLANSPALFIFSICSGLLRIFIDLPFEAHIYEKAKENSSVLEFLAMKEASFLPGRLLLFILLIIFSSQLEISFFLGGVSSFLLMFL